MEVPPDNELVFACHCRAGRRPKGYVPKYDNDGDDLLDLVESEGYQNPIRTVSDDAYFVDVKCPDPTMERNKWSDIPDGSIQIVWGQYCPVYSIFVPQRRGGAGGVAGVVKATDGKDTVDSILAGASSKLKAGGVIVFPTHDTPLHEIVPYNPPGWQMMITTEFPFLVKPANQRVRQTSGFIVYTKMAAAGKRKTLKQRLAAAKKKCSPGYEVYGYRKNAKGEFFNCLPAGLKRRKTRRTT
jgi:hypothetical protein